jgi:hypothetical protein
VAKFFHPPSLRGEKILISSEFRACLPKAERGSAPTMMTAGLANLSSSPLANLFYAISRMIHANWHDFRPTKYRKLLPYSNLHLFEFFRPHSACRGTGVFVFRKHVAETGRKR